MARNAFRVSPGDRNAMHELPDEAPVRVRLTSDPEVEVVEVDDMPEDDRGRPTNVNDSILDQEDDLREQLSARAQKRIDRLKFETNTERRAREAAERERDAAVELARRQNDELGALRRQLDSGSTALANSMKAEREARIGDAQRRLEQAHADGDNAAIAKATSDLSQAQAELVAITARAPAPRTEQPAAQAQPAAPAPAQQAPQMAPNVAAWIAHNNSWFNRDKAKTALAMSIHGSLQARGVRPESDEYTKELDKGLKTMYPDHQPFSGSSGNGDDGETTRPRRTNVVTEGSRGDPVSRPSPTRVELTSSEVAIAKKLGVPLERYAAEKQRRAAGERSGAR